MTTDVSQLNLAEPEQINWDNYDTGGSKYVAPPPALGPDGKPVTYYGVAEKATEETERPDTNLDGQPVLTYLLDPVKIVGASIGDAENGKTLRFTRISTRPFYKNQPDGTKKALNANTAGNFLRAAGLTGVKPQTNDQYRAAIRMAAPKKFGFTLDWEARDKVTGERVKGYANFPLDPDRPGQRKAILKQGDFYTGENGEQKQVQAEVLFANARLRYFQDPTRGR